MRQAAQPSHSLLEVFHRSGVGQIAAMQENITIRHIERRRMCIADTYESDPLVRRRWWKSFGIVVEMNDLFGGSEDDVVVVCAHCGNWRSRR